MAAVAVANSPDPVVRCRSITKYFGGVQALANVSFSPIPGEVLCLGGGKGAGKAPLSKIICGQLHPDAGDVWIGARPRPRLTPLKALELGIPLVSHALPLAANLGASDK